MSKNNEKPTSQLLLHLVGGVDYEMVADRIWEDNNDRWVINIHEKNNPIRQFVSIFCDKKQMETLFCSPEIVMVK